MKEIPHTQRGLLPYGLWPYGRRPQPKEVFRLKRALGCKIRQTGMRFQNKGERRGAKGPRFPSSSVVAIVVSSVEEIIKRLPETLVDEVIGHAATTEKR